MMLKTHIFLSTKLLSELRRTGSAGAAYSDGSLMLSSQKWRNGDRFIFRNQFEFNGIDELGCWSGHQSRVVLMSILDKPAGDAELGAQAARNEEIC